MSADDAQQMLSASGRVRHMPLGGDGLISVCGTHLDRRRTDRRRRQYGDRFGEVYRSCLRCAALVSQGR